MSIIFHVCTLLTCMYWINGNMCRCDCFILKDILNNWSDEASSTILNNLFTAISKGSRILIIERVLHTGGAAEEMVNNKTIWAVLKFM